MRASLRDLLFVEDKLNPVRLGNTAAWYDLSLPASTTSNDIRIDASNRVSLIADKSGNSAVNCLCLNGVAGNYASFTALTAFGTGDFTVSVRMRVLTLAATQTVWGSGNNGFAFKINNTGKVVSSKTGVADNTVSVATVAVYQLVTMTYVRSGTSGIYYFDGVADNTISDSVNYTVGLSLLGQATASNPTTGNIHWARVYNAALTAPQVLADSNGTVQANCVLNIDWTSYAKLAASPVTAATGQSITINATGDLGARIAGERDLYQATASKQPVLLPFTGTKYGYLNGVAGNYFSTPDSAALSITGDIDIIAQVKMADWTPSVSQRIVSKFVGGTNQRSYLFSVIASGSLSLALSFNGTASTAYDSTAATGFSNDTTNWVRAVRTGSTVRFYTSSDGVSWTQLGTDVAAVSTALYDGTAAIEVGATEGGTAGVVTGSIYCTRIWNGISDSGGTLVFDFNPAAYVSGTTFLDSSSNGATITLNGGATIVTRPCLYFDGSNDYLKSAAFSYAQPESVYFVGSQVSFTAFDRFFDGNTGQSLRLQQWSVANELGFSTESGKTITSSALGSAQQTSQVYHVRGNGASGLIRVNRGTAVTGDSGAGNANGFTLAANGDGTAPGNITASEILIRSAADGQYIQDRIIRYAGRKWGIQS